MKLSKLLARTVVTGIEMFVRLLTSFQAGDSILVCYVVLTVKKSNVRTGIG